MNATAASLVAMMAASQPCIEIEEQLRAERGAAKHDRNKAKLDRRKAQDAILTWRTIAAARLTGLDSCIAKLATRTASVTMTLTLPPEAPKEVKGTSPWAVVAAAVGGLGLGIVVGAALVLTAR